MTCKTSKIALHSDTKIIGRLTIPDNPRVAILFLHGGKPGTKERFSYAQDQLCSKGIASLAIDFRGVGESGGDFEDGSLNHRLKDVQAALDFLRKYSKKKFICGSSMGGHVAVRLANSNTDVAGLILAYAAAYSEEAEDKPLNNQFTEVIRKDNSWKGSPIFSLLTKWFKPILVLYGENDQVIPQGVIEEYKKATKRNGEFYILENGGHRLFEFETIEQKAVAEVVNSKIVDFIFRT